MALLTQADLETVLQRNFTNDPDPVVAAIIAQAESLIDGVVGRPLESASYTHEVDGPGGNTLWVGRWPVTAVTSVTVDGTAWANNVDYKWRSDGRFVALGDSIHWNPYTKDYGGWWPTGVQNVEIVYDAGYVTAPFGYVPVAAQIAKRIYEDGANSANSPDGIVQETVGGTSLTYSWQNQASSSGGLTEDERRQILSFPWAQRRKTGAVRL